MGNISSVGFLCGDSGRRLAIPGVASERPTVHTPSYEEIGITRDTSPDLMRQARFQRRQRRFRNTALFYYDVYETRPCV